MTISKTVEYVNNPSNFEYYYVLLTSHSQNIVETKLKLTFENFKLFHFMAREQLQELGILFKD